MYKNMEDKSYTPRTVCMDEVVPRAAPPPIC